MGIEETALLKWLWKRNPDYVSKARELREEVARWLSYVPHTFPHYTSHTVDHSDEIIRQISKLLFSDRAPSKPVIKSLSPTEAYIVIAAAYLHDAGMVVSNEEKNRIVGGDEWPRWLDERPDVRRRRHNEIAAMRPTAVTPPAESDARNLMADVQLRFLIAEYIRGRHHERAGQIVHQHEAALGRFAFGDHQLQAAIGDVCVGHGLQHRELDDDQRYPHERDIHNDTVDLRLAAILLRLGDLLDMRSSRACPLLLNAASPLPADSLAHWTQYFCNYHRVTAPDRIEIGARCVNRDEHRVLRIWCEWIVGEVENARSVMAKAPPRTRHKDWHVPRASFGPAPDGTITIEPAKDARYFPHDWKFEIEQHAILERVVRDLGDTPHAFIRELIENGLDAMRCQMYRDFETAGADGRRVAPTKIPEDVRRRYRLRIRLVEKDVVSRTDFSQVTERRQSVVVDDTGTGMDEAAIRGYLLRPGRSYYTTESFRSRYSFTPAGHSGLGFLSVFAVSDDVVVETCADDGGGSIRFKLSGPHEAVLAERGDRRSRGTCVEVMLRERIDPSAFQQLLDDLCGRVEFPIDVDIPGVASYEVKRERPEDFIQAGDDPSDRRARWTIRAFPIDAPGVDGELYVRAKLLDGKERWDVDDDEIERLRLMSPRCDIPQLPSTRIWLHGLHAPRTSPFQGALEAVRLDLRGKEANARPTDGLITASVITLPRVAERWEQVLNDHIGSFANEPEHPRWRYLQAMMNRFPLSKYWRKVPGTMPCYGRAPVHLAALSQITIDDVLALPSFTVVVHRRRIGPRVPSLQVEEPIIPCDGILFRFSDLTHLSRMSAMPLLARFWPSRLERHDSEILALTFEQRPATEQPTKYHAYFDRLVHFEDDRPLAIQLQGNQFRITVVNYDHPLNRWVASVNDGERDESKKDLVYSRILGLISMVHSSTDPQPDDVVRYLERWRALAQSESAPLPPSINPGSNLFELPAHFPAAASVAD